MRARATCPKAHLTIFHTQRERHLSFFLHSALLDQHTFVHTFPPFHHIVSVFWSRLSIFKYTLILIARWQPKFMCICEPHFHSLSSFIPQPQADMRQLIHKWVFYVCAAGEQACEQHVPTLSWRTCLDTQKLVFYINVINRSSRHIPIDDDVIA